MYYSVIKYGDTSEQVMLKFPTLHYIIITAFGGSKLTIGLYMKALHAVDRGSFCNRIFLFYFFFVFCIVMNLLSKTCAISSL